jgi:hypothetical protein
MMGEWGTGVGGGGSSFSLVPAPFATGSLLPAVCLSVQMLSKCSDDTGKNNAPGVNEVMGTSALSLAVICPYLGQCVYLCSLQAFPGGPSRAALAVPILYQGEGHLS